MIKMRVTRRIFEMPAIVSFEEDIYIARCPLLQGAFAEGETPEDAVANLVDVVKAILQYRKERGEEDPLNDLIIEADRVASTIPIGLNI